MASFDDLPDELVVCIINHLPTYQSLRSLGKVSKRLHYLTDDPRVVVDWLMYQHDLDTIMAFLTIGNDSGHLPDHLALRYMQHLLGRAAFTLPRYLYQLALEASEPHTLYKETLRAFAMQSYPAAYWEKDDLINSAEHPSDISIYSQSMLGYSSFPVARDYIQKHFASNPLNAIRCIVEEAHFNVHFNLAPWRGCTFGSFEDGVSIIEKAIASGHVDAVFIALSYVHQQNSAVWLAALSKASYSYEGDIFVYVLGSIHLEDTRTGFWTRNNLFPLQKRHEALLEFLASSAKNMVTDCFCKLLESADMLNTSAAQSQRIWMQWSIRHWQKYSQILIFVEKLLMVLYQQGSRPASPAGFSHLSSQTEMIDNMKPLLSRLYFQMSTLTRVPS